MIRLVQINWVVLKYNYSNHECNLHESFEAHESHLPKTRINVSVIETFEIKITLMTSGTNAAIGQ